LRTRVLAAKETGKPAKTAAKKAGAKVASKTAKAAKAAQKKVAARKK
jgi:hypothetical protein